MTQQLKTAWIERCAARLLALRPSMRSEHALVVARQRWEHQSALDPESAADSELRWEDATSHTASDADVIEGPAFRSAGIGVVPLAIGRGHDYFAAARLEGEAASGNWTKRPIWTQRAYLHPSEALDAARWLAQALIEGGVRRASERARALPSLDPVTPRRDSSPAAAANDCPPLEAAADR
ncbi:hypothetical protein [Caldimonas brevitalea]|uniref:Uncharacterized protein n=1 Tax=Caldimonas brevitalea TaxID=413882 RepID=A0A0G3BJQ9_9BURK|nr:hypothetical protein [Caldimonas brevitalea]AKJ29622.1 hypothetical protein AAW51_2931 [Caldimonas brevitalea]